MRRSIRRLTLEILETRSLLDGGAAGGGADGLPVWAEGESSPMPNFAAQDVNPASPRANQDVSPRDYLEQVSGWYFTHAT